MNFWHFMFFPKGQPWYMGAIWGNVLQGVLFLLPGISVILWRQEKNHREAERHRRKVEKHLKLEG